MKRRELLYVTGATGMLAVAGCISDEGDDGADDGGAGPAGDQDDGDADGSESGDDSENGDDGEEEGDSDPLEIARQFLEAWSEAEIDRVNELIHEDSEMEKLDEDARAELEEVSFTMTELELTDESDDAAIVAFLLEVEPEGEEESQTVSQELELRMEGEVWRVWQIRQGEEERLPGPAVQFGTDHDDDGLTIRHEGGDHVAAANLFVRGEGLSETGSWLELGGETSSENGDGPAVAAGDQVTVDIEDEYTLRIVWDDGENSRVLRSVSGARDTVSDIDAPPEALEYLEDTDNFTGVADFTGDEAVTVLNGELENGGQPFGFDPAAVRITPGTEVTWEWVGDGPHSVAHEDGEFESEVLDGESATFSHTFEEPGIYLYYCAPHRALEHKGAVIVEEAGEEEGDK